MSNTGELRTIEESMERGLIQFAEGAKRVRDENLYPGAKQEQDAWKTYCKERWGQSKAAVDDAIRALPVLVRHEHGITVSAAANVASLQEAVQDAILAETTLQRDVQAKAKAARKVQRKAESEGREATVEEQIEAAQNVKPPKKRKQRKASKFVRYLEAAYYEVQQAADYAQGDVLSDTENDFGWNRVAKIRYELERIEDKLYQPDHVKDDADAEFAKLLAGGDES